MILSLNKMRFSFAAAFFLLAASAASATPVESAKIISRKDKRAFRKAMEPNQFDSNIAKAKISQKLFAKAKPVNGGLRKLNDGNNDDQWGDFGFDVSQYSIKYAGCSAVQTYNDELAEDEESDTVLANKRFVIFRLCPTSSCNPWSVLGCTSDYGEYLIELDDYLQAVSEYYEEKTQLYCEYCANCVQEEEAAEEGDDAAAEEGDDAAAEEGDDAAAEEGDDAAAEEGDDAAAAEGDDGQRRRLADAADDYCDEDLCADYADTCYDQDEGDDAMDVRDFMACVAVEYSDDLNYYLAPHCSSDGFTVTMGVYTDDECRKYASDMTATQVLGFDLDTSLFSEYFPKECTSCAESDNAYENNQEDNDDNNGISEICENLYMDAAKCNKNFDSYTSDSYQGNNQASEEDSVCDFVTSLLEGNYDETGSIVIDTNWYFNTSNWRDADEYLNEAMNVKNYVSTNVDVWQMAAMVLAIGGCLYMWVWICCLRSALGKRNIPWKPRRGKDIAAGDISRQNSGILSGRSRSGVGTGTAPLI